MRISEIKNTEDRLHAMRQLERVIAIDNQINEIWLNQIPTFDELNSQNLEQAQHYIQMIQTRLCRKIAFLPIAGEEVVEKT